MEHFGKDMDFFFNTISRYPRQFPSPMQVRDLYYHPRKTQFARMTFDMFCVSFIFQGNGRYKVGDFDVQVQAPCVITEWPGPVHEYGADVWWEEFAFTCSPTVLGYLKRSRLITGGRYVWPMQHASWIRLQSERIMELMERISKPGAADEIDRLCELILMRSQVADAGGDEREQKVGRIREALEARFREEIDYERLARKHGLSLTGFHRYWKKYQGGSPADYVVRRRIQEACRLLVSTDMAIGEIAFRVGFADPLYFSRKFRQSAGVTAREFRRKHGGGG